MTSDMIIFTVCNLNKFLIVTCTVTLYLLDLQPMMFIFKNFLTEFFQQRWIPCADPPICTIQHNVLENNIPSFFGIYIKLTLLWYMKLFAFVIKQTLQEFISLIFNCHPINLSFLLVIVSWGNLRYCSYCPPSWNNSACYTMCISHKHNSYLILDIIVLMLSKSKSSMQSNLILLLDIFVSIYWFYVTFIVPSRITLHPKSVNPWTFNQSLVVEWKNSSPG